MRIIPLGLCVALLGTAGCMKDPQDPQAVSPASQAAGTAESSTVPVEKMQAPTILAAQVGSVIDDSGLLAESAPAIDAGLAVHGLALFQGPQGASGEVEMQVLDAAGSVLHSEKKPYTIQGTTAVGFTVPAEKALAKGQYKGLFLCNGGPCWEVPFEIR